MTAPRSTSGAPAPAPVGGFSPLYLLLAAAAFAVWIPGRAGVERVAAFLLTASAFAAAARSGGDETHVPVRDGLAAMVGLDAASAVLMALFLRGGPYFGVARVAFHAHQAATLAGIFVLPVTAASVFLRPGRRVRLVHAAVASTFLALVAHVVVAYPAVRSMPHQYRGEWLRLRYLFAEVVALFVACAAAWRTHLTKEEASRLPAVTVWCLISGGLALFAVGAWSRGLFGSAYAIHQYGLVALYGVVLVLHCSRAPRQGVEAAS